MNIKRTIHNLIFIIGIGLISLLTNGCIDDLSKGFDIADLGKKVNGTLSVPLGSTSPVTVTRAVDFNEDAQVKIDSYWVGIFDTKTGELLGMAHDNHPRKEDGTRHTMKSGSAPFSVDNIEIWYYDKNPEAYIAGVINYNNVKVKRAGESETTTLAELLPTIKHVSDIYNISVDGASADAANRSLGSDESCPLMMGFYRTGNSKIHNTLNPDGSMSQNDTKIRLVGGSDNHSEIKLADGAVNLMRLNSEINVNISAGENVTIKNVEYKVVNNPSEVFLMEHTTDGGGSIRNSKEDYLANTANSADFLENGYDSDSYYRTVAQNDGIYSFTYQKYENKHWGRSRTYPDGYNEASHISREQKFDVTAEPEEAVYMSLCNDPDKHFNNSASFMILKVDLEYGEEYSEPFKGTIYYTIHEGCASNRDGSSANNGFDYQRIRNTRYNYNIYINGIDNLKINVDASDYYNDHNDGISGQLSKIRMETVGGYGTNSSGVQLRGMNYEDFLDIYNNRKNLKWRYYISTPTGNYNYGNWTDAVNESYDWPAISSDFITECPEEVLSSFKFYVLQGSGGHSEDGGWIDGQVLKKWTIKEFIEAEGELPYEYYPNDWDNSTRYYISIPRWDVEAKFSDYKYYQRGFYFCYDSEDNDNCSISNFMGFLQTGPYDSRSYPSSPWIPDLPTINPSWYEGFNNGYQMAAHTLDYITWQTANIWYNNEEHEITSFKIQIDDDPEFVVGTQYRKYKYPEWNGTPYYEMPVLTDEIGIGDHIVKITPIVDEDYVQPARTSEFELRIIDSKWHFDNVIWPVFPKNEDYYLKNNTQWKYSGLKLYCTSGGGSRMNSEYDSKGEGFINMAGTGNRESRAFQIDLAKPGKILVDAQYPTGSNIKRGVYLDNGLKQVFKEVDFGTRMILEFDTNEIFDNEAFLAAGYPVYIYCLESLRIYSIEFIPD